METWQRYALVLLGTAVVQFVIGIGFLWQKNIANRNNDEAVASLQSRWESEDREREARQEEELQSKYGTTKLDRIAFDPRLDVELVLLKMFEAALPSEYLVTVKVYGFSEYSINVNVFNMPETDKLARPLKEIFSRVKPKYVHKIVFTDEDNYWLINRGQLLRVGNWKKASVSQIMRYCFQ
jgi:hypothetical protein